MDTIMRYLVMVMLALGLVGCGGPYADLQEAFHEKQPSSASPIPASQITLTGTRHEGAYNYNRIFTVKLLPTDIALEPSFPSSLIMKAVRIPVDHVGACSKTCFGPGVWDADVLVPISGTEMSFRQGKEIVDWCWANKIPIISAKDRSQWLHASEQLPDRTKFKEQFESRERYDQAAQRSCEGY